MTHEEIQELLEGYVDETLDRATRREVDIHLATCDECRSILDGVAPVELGSPAGSWDQKAMGRAVRRSILRVAADALLLLFAGWIAAWLLSLLILQPFVLNRGGRAVAATVATADLAILSNPGVTMSEYAYHSAFLSRTTEVDVSLPVGSAVKEVGSIQSRIGLFAFGSADGGPLWPVLYDENELGGEESLRAVGEGTVATVQVWFEDAIEVDTAQAMVGTPADVSVVWAGFEVAGVEGSALAPAGVLGYGTCSSQYFTAPETAAGSSGGGSGDYLGMPASVSGALEETQRALRNLLDYPELTAGTGASVEDVTEALERLETPMVEELVVTGPTGELLDFIDEVDPTAVSILAIDFLNWSEPPCAR
ncbi:MAG: zf-HC2 domain-containing protein [Acidimicrobiia bacterium]